MKRNNVILLLIIIILAANKSVLFSAFYDEEDLLLNTAVIGGSIVSLLFYDLYENPSGIVLSDSKTINQALLFSTVCPGLGQYYLGYKTKGIVLMSSAAVTGGYAIYRFQKHPDELIHNNVAYLTFFSIWLFNLYDTFVSGHLEVTIPVEKEKIVLVPTGNITGIKLSYRF